MKRIVASAILTSLALLSGPAQATGEAVLQLLPADESHLSEAGAPPVIPEGSVVVFGRFDDPALSIADANEIALVAPDGRQAPLHIEEKSLFREFDQIISMRLFFVLPEADLSAALRLQWGPEVRAANTVGEGWALAGIPAERLRQFGWSQPGAAGDAPSLATIEVIADSRADYYFLWYLLPISVLFALLTIRKIRARHSTD